MKKKPFKPILVHHICITDKELISKGKSQKNTRMTLVENNNNITLEQVIDEYIEDFKLQAPETYKNYEHVFSFNREGYFDISPIPIPSNKEKKSCIKVTCKTTSEKQSQEQFVKNFRKTLINRLDNALDYYEFYVSNEIEDSSCNVYYNLIQYEDIDEIEVYSMET